jgi:hypothetical protein
MLCETKGGSMNRTDSGRFLRFLPWVGLLLLMPGVFPPPAQAAIGPCRADIDRDGDVDIDDLNLILGNFGNPDPTIDIDGDGLIGSAELNLVLGNFELSCRCPGDVDGNGRVEAADEQLILSSLGRDCRLDLDQNGTAQGGKDLEILQSLFGTSGPLGDLNGDGTVDFDDLNLYLGGSPADCRADVNGDGKVDSADLALYFSSKRCCRQLTGLPIGPPEP